MTNSDNPTDSQEFYGERRTLSTICPGMEIEPPLCTDAIAWQIILLGADCGRSGDEIAEWLTRLEDLPFWPDRESLAVYLRDAGL